jgi:hypothetical protein
MHSTAAQDTAIAINGTGEDQQSLVNRAAPGLVNHAEPSWVDHAAAKLKYSHLSFFRREEN